MANTPEIPPQVKDIFEMKNLPMDPEERAPFERLIEEKFMHYVENRAPGVYKDIVQCKFDFEKHADGSREQSRDLFDEFILDEASVIGPRLLVHPAVFRRMIEWHDSGDKQYDQLLESLGLCARVCRGERRRLIREREWYLFKKDAVSELNILKNLCKTHEAALGRRRAPGEALAFISDELLQPRYERLAENRTSLLSYFEKEEHSLEAELFASGALSPAQLADSLIAWSCGYEPESARKAVSITGNLQRKEEKEKKTSISL